MSQSFCFGLVLLCGFRFLTMPQEKKPEWALRFSDYAVTNIFRGKPAAPRLTTRTHRMFRSVITAAARKGPNFAGHYTVAEWGCGAGCVSIAVLDATSGKAFSVPFKTLSMPLREHEGEHEYQGPVYRLDSRLLIADGCPDETHCGTYYYEWKDNQLKLLGNDTLPAAK